MKKAVIVKMAGVMNGNSLFAIMDVNGRCERQIWSTKSQMLATKLYLLCDEPT